MPCILSALVRSWRADGTAGLPGLPRINWTTLLMVEGEVPGVTLDMPWNIYYNITIVVLVLSQLIFSPGMRLDLHLVHQAKKITLFPTPNFEVLPFGYIA